MRQRGQAASGNGKGAAAKRQQGTSTGTRTSASAGGGGGGNVAASDVQAAPEDCVAITSVLMSARMDSRRAGAALANSISSALCSASRFLRTSSMRSSRILMSLPAASAPLEE